MAHEMAIYRLDPDNDRFHNFALADESDAAIYHRFNGTPLGDEWKSLEIMAVDTDDELAQLGDHALLGTIPVFSERAIASLADTLKANGEALPLVYSRQPYFAFNVTSVVDALDEGLSKLQRFSSGRVMSIDEFVFRPESVRGRSIFKIPQLPRAFVFVTDDFVDRVRAAGLQGFDFHEVWRHEVRV